MTELPALGGNNSIGAGDNSRGQIVGRAENNVQDPTCAPPSPVATQFLQFEATLWERERRGAWQVHELPPYPGDSDGAATAINDFGRAVGISGQCDVAIGAYTAIHALLWEDGKPIDLGNLGGHGWNTPAAINNRGVIAGSGMVRTTWSAVSCSSVGWPSVGRKSMACKAWDIARRRHESRDRHK